MRVKAYKHNYGVYTEIGGNVTAYHWETAGMLWWRKKKWVKKRTDELWLTIRFTAKPSRALESKIIPGGKKKNSSDVDSLQHEERDVVAVSVQISPKLSVSPKFLATMKADGAIVIGKMRKDSEQLGPASVSVGYVR
jgi:hypothetical protein